MRKENLFVYGSLKKGGSNHDLIDQQLENRDAEYIQPASVCGFELYDKGTFPVAVPGNGELEGEIYRIPHKFLIGKLDHLEGFPHRFNRKQILIDDFNCWIYYQESAPPESEKLERSSWSTRGG